MSTASHYPHILDQGGKSPCLERWPRVRVAQIAMDHVRCERSAEEIARQYPHLAPAEIHAALAYYFDHQGEIDREIQAEVRQADLAASTARHTPLATKLAALAHP